jgi:predicted aspartyl protease
VSIRHRLVYLLLTALLGCASAEDRSSLPDVDSKAADAVTLTSFLATQGYESLPLRPLATGHFALDGTADAIVLTLIVDTGASHTILDRRRAERFGLVLRQERGRAAGLGTADERVASAVLRNVRLGGLELDSLPVSVLDLAHVNEVLREMRVGAVDGILGADVLHRKQAIIDYGAPRLYIRQE